MKASLMAASYRLPWRTGGCAGTVLGARGAGVSDLAATDAPKYPHDQPAPLRHLLLCNVDHSGTQQRHADGFGGPLRPATHAPSHARHLRGIRTAAALGLRWSRRDLHALAAPAGR